MRYIVEQTATAAILWEGEASSAAAALDAHAAAAGCGDYAALCVRYGVDAGVVAYLATVECAYCGHTGEDRGVPAVDDHAAWERESADHSADCEWARTRAFRRY